MKRQCTLKIILINVFIFFTGLNAHAEQKESTFSSVEYELDAYYSNIALLVNLTDNPVPYLGEKNEFEVYSNLVSNALYPRFLILEASIYPMPILGTKIRKHQPNFYNSFNIGENNLIQSVTAGFEEPFALTVFLGNSVNFSKSNTSNTKNRAFMGLLFSAGTQHITDSLLVDDNWYELEWKIKGDKIIDDEKLSWSFRGGFKFHDHKNISDLYYVAIKRKHIGYHSPVLSWLFNSGYEVTFKFDQKTNKPIEQSIFIDKKIPYQAWNVSFSIGVGLINTNKGKYSGLLRDTADQTIFVIRPSIEF